MESVEFLRVGAANWAGTRGTRALWAPRPTAGVTKCQKRLPKKVCGNVCQEGT